ncbi:30S ribosome-binding factor RbfA [Haloechinothrix sp. YIM 98757]|uniref:Ribosome-binding factor A n=1 Tax=Haloechinothrix aidingensis TaxID=2752311 RepID=A0A838AAC5_9PSEU|nr:30S ribosome-binding factor RbfA [Haloechinothrix aidingensis]MBA0126171.1 30S ribosome-binding factor RbfA [Haloechinothrix aidingensis]
MTDNARARRLAKRIGRIVAAAIEHEIKDPRLGNVTITDTKLTGDLRDATLYYTVLGENLDADPDFAGAEAALVSARGVLRSKVGEQIGVRFTPTLTFVADSIPADARRIDELLAQAKEADAEVARQATGAEPAGDPDPYRLDPAENEVDETDEAEEPR